MLYSLNNNGENRFPQNLVLFEGKVTNSNNAIFSVDFGKKKKNRLIVLSHGTFDGTVSDQYASTSKINGVDTKKINGHGQFNGTNKTVHVGLHSLPINFGGSANVEIISTGFAGTQDQIWLTVYDLYGFDENEIDAQDGFVNTPVTPRIINTIGADLVILNAMDYNTSPLNWTSGGNNLVSLDTYSIPAQAYDTKPKNNLTSSYNTNGTTTVSCAASFGRRL